MIRLSRRVTLCGVCGIYFLRPIFNTNKHATFLPTMRHDDEKDNDDDDDNNEQKMQSTTSKINTT